MLRIKVKETLSADKLSVNKTRYTYFLGIMLYKYVYETSALKVLGQFDISDKQKSSGIGL